MYQTILIFSFQGFVLNCFLIKKVSIFFNVNIYNYINYLYICILHTYMYIHICTYIYVCTLVIYCYYIFNDNINNNIYFNFIYKYKIIYARESQTQCIINKVFKAKVYLLLPLIKRQRW